MSQHFLLSAAARGLSLARIAQMTDQEARATFQALAALFNRRTRALLYHYKDRGMVRAVQGNEDGRRRFNWWELAI